MLYLLIFVVLLMAELIYFRIADKCNIIDKPNQRSSHSKVVLRGGGVIFLGRYMGVELSLWFPVSVDVGSGDFSCWNIVCG